MVVHHRARKKTLRTIQYYTIAIAIMPCLFIYSLWATRGELLLPRVTGAIINIAITYAFIVALRAQKAKLDR